MNLSRRGFLVSTAAVLAARPALTQVATPGLILNAGVADVQLLPETYGKTTIWGFDATSPGPEIRVRQGARVQRTLTNNLPQATSTHWHGIRISNAMDGVAGLTQTAVPPGASFEYDFVAPDAGTYWYHAHNRSFEQVARGLYGALIVEEPEPLDVDREEVLIFDDWRIDPETAQIDSEFGASHDTSHGGRLGNYITTNGIYNLALDARRNERLRLRLINASNARIFALRLEGLDGWTVALDGMPLVAPQKVTDTIFLGSAQRVDLIVDVVADVGETAHIAQLDRDETFSQVAFEVRSGGTGTKRGAPVPLPPNPHPVVDLNNARALTLRMEGGAMGGLSSATLGGESKTMREVVDSGRYWAFNGAADGLDGPPLAKLTRGEHVRITIANETAFPHVMHLHGMHFHEISETGRLGPLRDTTLIDRGAEREIAFVANNPGQWLLHCHMLSHAASGMSTRIVVA